MKGCRQRLIGLCSSVAVGVVLLLLTAWSRSEASPSMGVPSATPDRGALVVGQSAVALPAVAPVASPALSQMAASDSATGKPSSGKETAADFFRGKTVQIVVGYGAGGGFDIYARLISRYLPKYIPGAPTVIVENKPGAGSLLAASYVYNVAPKDGTVIGNFSGDVFVQYALGGKGTNFDPKKFQYLGAPVSDHQLCVTGGKSSFKNIRRAQGSGSNQLVLGADAQGGTLYNNGAVVIDALGLHAKLVPGYQGTAAARLAMERGEIDGFCGWSWESLKTSSYEDVVAGTIVPILQISEEPIADLPVKNVPLAHDLAKTDEARMILHTGLIASSRITRTYALPPSTPPDRVNALRKAFLAALQDPELLADAKKAKLAIAPVSGERVRALVDEIISMPEGVKARLKQVLLTR